MTSDGQEPAAAAPAERGWRRVVPTLAAALAVFVFVSAGNWQRARMHEKRELAAQVEAAASTPPVPMARVAGDWSRWRYRVVMATGTFDAGRQILLDNRVHAGRVGYQVVTPLALNDGRAVLVNRGFVPAGRERSELPQVPPPTGPVTVRGRINIPPANYIELGRAAPAGNVWQNLDPARFRAATGLDVLPVVIEALDGPADGLVREWPVPEDRGGKHLGYMVQWYLFAVIVAVLWVWFTFRRRR